MMGRKRLRWELIGFLWTAAVGTLLHFLYGWSGSSRFVAPFASVNGSVFEQLKILFVPVFLFSFAEFFFVGRERPDFLAVRGISIWAGTLLLPVVYYTYSGALGFDVPWADAVIFFATAALTFLLDRALARRGRLSAPIWQLLGLVLLFGGLFVLIFFTFRPVMLPFWLDPATGQYGIP